MTAQTKRIYEFGPFRVDAVERVLLRDGKPEPIPPKAFDVLLVLVESSGHIVEKDELMNRVWSDSFVEEGNLKVTVSVLRKALDQSAGEHQYIETVPRRGYRFTADVTEVSDSEPELMLLERSRVQLVIENDEEPGDLRTTSNAHYLKHLAVQEKETAIEQQSVLVRGPARAESLAEFISAIVQHKRRLMIAAAVLVIAASGISFGVYKLISGNGSPTNPTEPFQKMKITMLTTSGKATVAAISPDGKYVAHAMSAGNQQSLWLRHIATGSDKEIVSNAQVRYQQLTFSPDGNYIYFVRFESEGKLYRVPVLGDSIQKLVSDVDSGITFSPDGRQIAYIRGYLPSTEARLIAANADGADEKTLLTTKLSGVFASPTRAWGPAWSPDGEMIAFGLNKNEPDGKYWNVMTVRVKDQAEQQITHQKWTELGQLTWLSDGSGLIVAAADEESSPSQQIRYVSYPSGDVRTITNDTNDYSGVTLTPDSTSLVTVQIEQSSNVWMAPAGDAASGTQITSNNVDGRNGICWAPEARIVYTTRARGSSDIWIMNADGAGQNRLTVDAGDNFYPSVSLDGRYIVFTSNRTADRCVWRMNIDGSNPKQLTHEIQSAMPEITPNGQWVVYQDGGSGTRTLWKVSTEGGKGAQLTDYFSRNPAVSPDGKQIAFVFLDEQATPKRLRIAIIPFDGGPPIKVFDLPPRQIRWTSDGAALTYVDARSGVSNIWVQPLDGSPVKQITNFTTDRIIAYAWSPDGKRLACVRGNQSSDVVLIAASR
jgi:Tol biopolymer transport system component/DNA-binding winged helix-turn-helix (wHTH) protein